MHNKYVIIDREILLTGSFNWTMQAVKFNNENLVVIKGKNIVDQYINNFQALWNKFEKNKIEPDNSNKYSELFMKLKEVSLKPNEKPKNNSRQKKGLVKKKI